MRASLPQLRTEGKTSWPSLKSLQSRIKDLIDEFGQIASLNDKAKQINSYLLKAKELAASME